MDQDTRPAPFNLGDHVRYIGKEQRQVPDGAGKSETTLVPGMAGVVIASTGALQGQSAGAPQPWRCQVQFSNGFHVDVTPKNQADFEVARGSGAATS